MHSQRRVRRETDTGNGEIGVERRAVGQRGAHTLGVMRVIVERNKP